MDYYSALKKGLRPHATTWMNLGGIMLSEIGQTQEDRHCSIPIIREITQRSRE